MIELIYMPFGSLNHPSIALGLFNSMLRDNGIPCRVRYLNFLLASMMGYRNYELTSLQCGIGLQVAEGLFRNTAWEGDFPPEPDSLLASGGELDLSVYGQKDGEKWIRDLHSRIIPQYLDRCADLLLGKADQGNEPLILGFSCSYFQTLPSIALARLVKRRRPDSIVVMGGAGFHDRIGQELFRALPFIDVVATGEADSALVPLFRSLEEKGTQGLAQLSGLSGLLARHQGEVVLDTPSRAMSSRELEALPTPDYSDYFDCLGDEDLDRETGLPGNFYLPMESSRGCWKGSRQHCAFCGLNPQELIPRRKSPDRVETEIRELSSSIPPGLNPSIHFTDNLLPGEYFQDLLPRLAESRLTENRESGSLDLFCEIRPTLTRKQVALMARAGFRSVQPGVESLSTQILKLMRKGTKAIRNVHFLVLCRTYGIQPRWNMLFRIPGEIPENYQEMARLIPRLLHLQPPLVRARKIELQPFSPMTREPGWALSMRPFSWYSELYPPDKVFIPRIAYFMEGDLCRVLSPENYRTFEERVRLWVSLWSNPSLKPELSWTFAPGEKEIVIQDSRSVSKCGKWELDQRESALYLAMAEPVSIRRLKRNFQHIFDDPEELEWVLHTFSRYGLIMEERGQMLSLAIPARDLERDYLERVSANQSDAAGER